MQTRICPLTPPESRVCNSSLTRVERHARGNYQDYISGNARRGLDGMSRRRRTEASAGLFDPHRPPGDQPRWRHTARAAFAAITLILTASFAHAKTPNQRADAEAKSFLTACNFSIQTRQGLCEINQSNFVEEYVYAKSGDISAMGSTAASFSPPPRDLSLGVPTLPIQACAWRLLIALRNPNHEDPLPRDMVAVACSHLPIADQTAARRRAEVLERELVTAPAVTPPDDWGPSIPGQKP